MLRYRDWRRTREYHLVRCRGGFWYFRGQERRSRGIELRIIVHECYIYITGHSAKGASSVGVQLIGSANVPRRNLLVLSRDCFLNTVPISIDSQNPYFIPTGTKRGESTMSSSLREHRH